ncbi:MAG TPA: universal stress protein [Ignavibacteriaceae bacterium]|nr:universal stress protein [Ignavibacteriaceae bacterium]
MFNIKNILLPTDFSNLSLSAARYAIDLAKQYGARIHFLNVLEKTPPILAIRSLDLSEEKIIKTIDEDARNSINKALEKINIDKSIEILPVIRKGIDFQVIIEYCESNNIDLIVIATHGRTGILHTLLGSVAEKVIRYATCPVLVITPSESEK